MTEIKTMNATLRAVTDELVVETALLVQALDIERELAHLRRREAAERALACRPRGEERGAEERKEGRTW